MNNSHYIKFNRTEAVTLSGLTMHQVRKLEQRKIIIPESSPIQFRWTQIIILRAIYYLRKDWSFKQLEKVLLKQPCHPVDLGIDNYKMIVCNADEFQVLTCDDVSYKRGEKQLELKDIYFSCAFIKETEYGVIRSKPYTFIDIPHLIKELWEIGYRENISNFGNKARKQPELEDFKTMVS